MQILTSLVQENWNASVVLFLCEELNTSGHINHSTVNGTSLTAVSLSYTDDISCERRCLLESKDSKYPMITLVTSQESDAWDESHIDFSATVLFLLVMRSSEDVDFFYFPNYRN